MPVTGHILMFISRVQRNPHEYLCATATECSAWNEILRCLRGCLPWDTNLNLHIARCIQIEALQAWTCRLLRRSSLLWFGDTSSFGFACTLIFFAVGQSYATFLCFSFLLCSHFLICFQFCVWFWLNRNESMYYFLNSSRFLYILFTYFTVACLLPDNHLPLRAPRRTQCMSTMNTASFSSYIKITAFSLPWSNNWRKDLDLFSPMAANLIFIAQDIMCKPIPNPLFQSTFPLSQ